MVTDYTNCQWDTGVFLFVINSADISVLTMNRPSASSSSVSSLHTCNGFSEPYPRLVIRMEGIPYQSHYEELYGQVRILSPTPFDKA